MAKKEKGGHTLETFSSKTYLAWRRTWYPAALGHRSGLPDAAGRLARSRRARAEAETAESQAEYSAEQAEMAAEDAAAYAAAEKAAADKEPFGV